jgi:hypothetical protein
MNGITILKNGKHLKLEGKGRDNLAKCPFDSTELESIGIGSGNIMGVRTEKPEDYLPITFKKAMEDSYAVYKCPKCGKTFLQYEEDDWDILHYVECKIEQEEDFGIRPNESNSQNNNTNSRNNANPFVR